MRPSSVRGTVVEGECRRPGMRDSSFGSALGGSVWIAWGEAEQALSDSVEMVESYTTSWLPSQGAWSSARRGFCPRIALN